MTVVNPKSISGINSITTGSGSDNLLTIHTSDASSTERVRINSSGDVIVGSGITVSPDGDIFTTGVTTATTFVGALTGNVTGNISGGTVAGSTGTFTGDVTLSSTAPKIVFTDSNNDPDFELTVNGGAFTVTDTTNSADRFKIDSAGKVGFGIAPTNKLHVYHATDNGILRVESGDSDARIDIKDNSGEVKIHAIGDVLTFNTSSSDTERARIDSGGKVHIGLTNGAGQFNVKNQNDSTTNAFEVYNDNGIRNAAFSQSSSGDATMDLRTNSASQTVLLRSNGVSHFSGGDFGINNSSPSAKLDVVDDGASGYIAEFRQGNTSNSAQIAIDSPTDSDSRPVLIDMQRAGTTKWSIGQGYNSSGGAFHLATSSLAGGVTGVKASFLTGGGITFNGDTAAANALDDYEEGSWNATSLNFQYDGNQAQRGSYIKIGRVVHAFFRVKFHTQTSTDHLRFSGLPFTAASGNPYDVGISGLALGYSTKDFNIEVSPGSAYAYWYTTTGSVYNNSTANNNADIRGVITYTAAS